MIMQEDRQLILVFKVKTNAPVESLKECIAMMLEEQLGDVRCIKIFVEKVGYNHESENAES